MALVQQGESYIVGFGDNNFEDTWTFTKADKKSSTTQENNLGEDAETENITITNHKYVIDFSAVVHTGGEDALQSGTVITVGSKSYLTSDITYAHTNGKLIVSGSMESYDSMTYA